MDIGAFLQTIDGFNALTDASARRLAEFAYTRHYRAGELIVERGGPGDSMFVVVEGSVRVPVVDDTGRQQFIAYLSEGKMFGEMALLTGEPRNADVVANNDCLIIVLPRDPVQEVLSEHPEIAGFLTAILGERLMQIGGVRQVGKYRLLGELGRGGMAYVYEGIHPSLARPVAIKMLSHTLLYRRHFAERFRNEARVIASLRHPNIVDVYDTEDKYATIFIIMEKLDGMDVERILDDRGRIDADEVRRIIRDVASALSYAHDRGIVHRDIKPSNIFISEEGLVKLTDFGIAAIEGVEHTMEKDEGMYLGTPVYSSPEHALGKQVDGRSDIYALGVVAYEMLLGNPPFDSESSTALLMHHVRSPLPNPRSVDPEIPRDLEDFIVRACSKDPRDRYQTCHEIVDFFDSIERRQKVPSQVRVKNITFVYSPDLESEVNRLAQTVQTMAESVDGLVTKIS